ncbi:YtfJ family protein [Martelella alba]|uniref:YtfJ family protein n=1 Tax=Martelella alba TaxID=2590451 RepID=A0ABY2SR31_9HYPH|nr:YtfJ family protein [Martelella alba]TKI08569.1 YtfJ family protein [Martelella alba]
MFRRYVLIILLWLISFGLEAQNLRIGAPLPKVGIAYQGELLYQDNEFSYKFWNSAQLTGKIHLIQHIAARTSASEMNAAMIESIRKANLPLKYYQTTTIMNGDDTLLGDGTYAGNWLKNNKKQSPQWQFILDGHGNARRAWGLKAKSSAIVVTDDRGRVRYVKEGPLTLQDVQQVTGLVRRLLPRGAR